MDEPRGPGELERMHDGGDARWNAGNAAAGHGAPGSRAAGHTALIHFEAVGHTYHSLLGRTIRAVDDFSLTIGESEVFGLAGPNGAGKSTLISLLLGYLEPTDGAVRIGGMKPRAFVETHGMGYLSELVAIPPRWKLEDALARYAVLAGLSRRERRERVAQVTALLGLEEQRGKRVKQLSKGNLQRLGLAQALLRDEQVIILDEPTHGLDPVWTQRFRDIVEGLRRPGRAIFIASHNLDELQRLADRVAIIDRGKLQRVVEPRAASHFVATAYLITVATGAEEVPLVFAGAEPRGENEFLLPVLSLDQLNAGVATLLQRGALISSLGPAHSMLEQHFRDAVGE